MNSPRSSTTRPPATSAVQVAVHRGVQVIGTAHEDNHPYLRKLGATPVTYGPGLVPPVRAAAQGPVDAALDAIGGQALRDSPALVPDRNRIATLVDHAVADELGVRGVRAVKSVRQMEEFVDLHTEGLLRITVRATNPLEAIVDAHRRLTLVEMAPGACGVRPLLVTRIRESLIRRPCEATVARLVCS